MAECRRRVRGRADRFESREGWYELVRAGLLELIGRVEPDRGKALEAAERLAREDVELIFGGKGRDEG